MKKLAAVQGQLIACEFMQTPMTALLHGAIAFLAALAGLYTGSSTLSIAGVEAGYWEVAAAMILTGLLLRWQAWARVFVWLPALTGFALGLAFRQIILSEQGLGWHPQTSFLIPALVWVGYEVHLVLDVLRLRGPVGNEILPEDGR